MELTWQGDEMVAEFENYADRTDGVTGDSIRAVAEDPARNVDVLAVLANELAEDEQHVAADIEGDIEAGTRANPDSARQSSTSLAQNGQYAVGLLRRYASHVDTFDEGVEDLNRRLRANTASARRIFQNMPDEDVPEYAETWSAEKAALRDEYERLTKTVEDDAETVATMFEQGATAENVRALLVAGLIPLSMATLWPNITLTPAERRRANRAAIRRLIDDLIDEGVLPAAAEDMSAGQLRQHLIDNPDVAAALMDQRPHAGLPGPAGELGALLAPVITTPEGAAAHHEQRRSGIRELFESLSPGDASMLAMLFPAAVGNTSGVPFANRADANTVAVVDALAAERGELSDLRDRHEDNQGGWNFWNDNDLEDPIENSEDRIALYESILADERQIILFDPADDGRIAELHGDIDADTQNLGVLVPGTGTTLENYDARVASRSRSFVDADPDQELAMVSWLGGDMPDDVFQDAPFNHYAQDMAPSLAGFSHDVRQELDHSSAADNSPSTTYIGHSYGGATVGLAETHGLDADRVLHVASAGMGHGVDDADDLPDSQARVDRYSITAPADFIGALQGKGAGDDIGHGADPDDFDGTERLHTGDYADGSRIDGPRASHGGVFKPQSDAWYNMLAVLTGGEAEGYRPTVYVRDGQGPGAPLRQEWGDGEMVDVP